MCDGRNRGPWPRDDYVISTDSERLDVDRIHSFLHDDAYWARGVPREVVERTIANSLNFGLFHAEDGQVGFARVVTDFGVIAYLADVFVLPPHRGRGLGRWLVATVVAHPDLQHLRRFTLATRDAHALYASFGFEPHPRPEDVLEIRRSLTELYGTPPE
jgi:N-acetylglutamate synthase-like GNAT family acetyltransferase